MRPGHEIRDMTDTNTQTVRPEQANSAAVSEGSYCASSLTRWTLAVGPVSYAIYVHRGGGGCSYLIRISEVFFRTQTIVRSPDRRIRHFVQLFRKDGILIHARHIAYSFRYDVHNSPNIPNTLMLV